MIIHRRKGIQIVETSGLKRRSSMHDNTVACTWASPKLGRAWDASFIWRAGGWWGHMRCVLSRFRQLIHASFFLARTLSWAGDEWDKKGSSVHGLILVCVERAWGMRMWWKWTSAWLALGGLSSVGCMLGGRVSLCHVRVGLNVKGL